MHCAAAYFASCCKNRFVDVMSPHTFSAEARQQSRMYVHHAVFVSWWYFPQAKPAALNDQVNVCGDEFLFNSPAELVDVGIVFCAYDFDVQSGIFCFFDPGHS